MMGVDEKLLLLSKAASSIPNRDGGRGVNASTIWRWCLKGIRGIRLESKMVGGLRFTSHEALERFFAALTDASSGLISPARPSARRQRVIEAAERRLDAVGV